MIRALPILAAAPDAAPDATIHARDAARPADAPGPSPRSVSLRRGPAS